MIISAYVHLGPDTEVTLSELGEALEMLRIVGTDKLTANLIIVGKHEQMDHFKREVANALNLVPREDVADVASDDAKASGG